MSIAALQKHLLEVVAYRDPIEWMLPRAAEVKLRRKLKLKEEIEFSLVNGCAGRDHHFSAYFTWFLLCKQNSAPFNDITISYHYHASLWRVKTEAFKHSRIVGSKIAAK